jgi:thiamine kinase-like enzyme
LAPPTPAVVADARDISPEWLTVVLNQAGHDVRVRSLRCEPVGTGQMAHNERITIEYESDAPGAPRTLVGKFPSPNEASRAAGAAGGYQVETRFYMELAHELPIRTPECLYGAISEDQSTFVLLLEDLAPAVQGDQIGGGSDEEIEAAIRNLAGLHAPTWNDPSSHQLPWLSEGIGDQFKLYIELGTPAFIDRYKDRLAREDVEVLTRFASGVGRWIERRPADRALVHGDYRLDNLMFEVEADACRVAAVDWQTLSVGCAGQDLAYLLGNSSVPEARRAHEKHMLDVYRQAMAELGVERSEDEIFEDYVYGSFQGPTITILGSLAVGQTDRGDDMFMAMAQRSLTQIRDLNSLDLLD